MKRSSSGRPALASGSWLAADIAAVSQPSPLRPMPTPWPAPAWTTPYACGICEVASRLVENALDLDTVWLRPAAAGPEAPGGPAVRTSQAFGGKSFRQEFLHACSGPTPPIFLKLIGFPPIAWER